jgi:ketosteroid isomerase-like protein
MRALIVLTVLALAGTPIGCETSAPEGNVRAEIEDALDRFHAADTTMNAEAVIDLLWPEFTMLVDGERVGFDDVAAGSRAFMATLDLFHTEWTDVEIVPLGPDHAVSSFLFRDSIRTEAGELLQSRGPTTLVWERRRGEWRAIHGDADHYPIEGG